MAGPGDLRRRAGVAGHVVLPDRPQRVRGPAAWRAPSPASARPPGPGHRDRRSARACPRRPLADAGPERVDRDVGGGCGRRAVRGRAARGDGHAPVAAGPSARRVRAAGGTRLLGRRDGRRAGDQRAGGQLRTPARAGGPGRWLPVPVPPPGRSHPTGSSATPERSSGPTWRPWSPSWPTTSCWRCRRCGPGRWDVGSSASSWSTCSPGAAPGGRRVWLGANGQPALLLYRLTPEGPTAHTLQLFAARRPRRHRPRARLPGPETVRPVREPAPARR